MKYIIAFFLVLFCSGCKQEEAIPIEEEEPLQMEFSMEDPYENPQEMLIPVSLNI